MVLSTDEFYNLSNLVIRALVLDERISWDIIDKAQNSELKI